MQPEPTSLYERIGGEVAIFTAVKALYERILADPALRPFFEGVEMGTQTRKMVGFLAHAFGGPVELYGRDLRTAHAKLVERGLCDAHFDAIIRHLDATLRELDVDEELRSQVLRLAESTRSAVLGRNDAHGS